MTGRIPTFLLTAFLLTSTACAQSTHLLDFIHPQAGQVGTTVEVLAEGSFLQQPEEVIFYQPGIRCTDMQQMDTKLNIQNGDRAAAEAGTSLKLTFEIAQDATPGEYQLRLRTHDNLSELVTFWVTPFPVMMEQNAWIDKEGARNDSPETAQKLPMNCTVVGYLPSSLPQDHDWYSVQCRKGDRLAVETVAARLGTLHYGGMNDPAIRIFNEAGDEVGRNDDNALHTQDAVLTVVIPEDGRYLIDMHQQMDYEAGRLRHYLMHVGTFARPMLAFPMGGPAGKRLPVVLLGDAAGDIHVNIPMPSKPGLFEDAYVDVAAPFSFNAEAAGDRNESEPSPAGAALNNMSPARPNRLHAAPFGNVIEAPEHNSPQTAQRISDDLPIAINGRIEAEGEVDWYRFTAKKGARYRVFTYAKSLDSELDARVRLRPAEGNASTKTYDEDDTVWDHHDLVGHHYRHQTKIRLDPVFMFEPDVDGEWLIGIGDTRREFSSHHIYRIEFQPHVDSAFVHFPAYPSTPTIVRDRVAVYRGHSYCRPVTIQPGFGSKYEKLLQLRALNLPSGVTMDCRPFRQGDGIIPVLFHAAADAKAGAALIDLVVEPVDTADRPNFRGGFIQHNQATNRRGDFAMYFNRTRKMALAVVEGATFDLEIERPKIPLVRNGELPLKVRVQRHDGFAGAVYCEMEWLPAGVNKQPPLIIRAGETAATYKLSASGNATPGEYQLSITGRENEGGNVRTAAGFHFVCSPSVPLNVGEPYVTIDLVRTAIERGRIGEIVGEITHHKPFSGDATLQLGRLPFGVKQVKPYPTVKPSDSTVKFRVEVTSDCLVGPYRDIFCDVAIRDGGQEIHQQTGNGMLRVDVERGVSR